MMTLVSSELMRMDTEKATLERKAKTKQPTTLRKQTSWRRPLRTIAEEKAWRRKRTDKELKMEMT